MQVTSTSKLLKQSSVLNAIESIGGAIATAAENFDIAHAVTDKTPFCSIAKRQRSKFKTVFLQKLDIHNVKYRL